ncbi:hypothetical protein RRG08_061019 [Elysia crispata]|uniref:Uncharacterized protein n=1 Tax=Elysia crispata TaxID=231223 RepID=A0AAE1AUL5_9GAST|nr:hypothetical protein RRG08_061019 [Elysia crispata]
MCDRVGIRSNPFSQGRLVPSQAETSCNFSEACLCGDQFCPQIRYHKICPGYSIVPACDRIARCESCFTLTPVS